MKKAFYTLGISLMAIGISSLSTNKNEDKVITPAYRQSTETTADAAAVSSCEGCHSGSATNGPIIIVYTDLKKDNFEIPIMEGTHQVIVYNPTKNDSFINQLTAYLSQIKINTNSISKAGLFASPKFYALHGGMRTDILQNCETFLVTSSTSTIVTMNTNDILRYDIKQATSHEITVNIEMKEERVTTVNVLDLSGKLVCEQTRLLTKGANEINVLSDQQLGSGLYLMQIKNDQQLVTKKFFIP
jgi:hypothetical protein